MSPLLATLATGIVTVLVTLLGGWFALAKLAREQNRAMMTAEQAREDKGRADRQAREDALITAISRGAEAQAQTAVILDAVRDYLCSLRRSERKILHALMVLISAKGGADIIGDRDSPEPPEIPSGRTIRQQEEHQ